MVQNKYGYSPTRVTNDENAGKSFTTFNASGGTVDDFNSANRHKQKRSRADAFEIDGADRLSLFQE